jgi:hypothetical protein
MTANARPPSFRTAKVVAVHRESHSVDCILMDGNWLRDVPVIGFGGSNFGLAALVAPTADDENKNRKTYPGEDGAGRDLYAVVAQAEGSSFGTNGMFVIGFLYPQVSEMMFAGDQWPDLFLFRHPSDVQVTIQQDGKTTVMHPAGAFVTIGENMDLVELEGKDFDALYRLRNNLNLHVGIRLKDTAGSVVTLDHEGNIDENAPIDVTTEAGRDRTETAGRDITESAKRDITETAKRDISEDATRDDSNKAGRDWSIDAGRDGSMKIGQDLSAKVGKDTTVKSGGKVDVRAGSSIFVEAGSASINRAGAVYSIKAPFIFLN